MSREAHNAAAARLAVLPQTLFLTDADISSLADWPSAIAALRRAYSAEFSELSVPPRSMARVSGAWLRGLTAISPLGGHLGCKLIAANTRERRVSYLVSLFDPDTMALAALLDGNQITAIRTAATTVVAVDALTRPGSLRVGVLGSGFEARSQLQALAAIRKITSVKVFSPTPANRERFAAELGKLLSIAIGASDSPEAAVTDVDLIICAARAKGEVPILRGEWLKPGMTIASVGSTLPEQREVDVDVIARSHAIVADMPDEVAHDTGDLRAATEVGCEFASKMMSLSDLMTGRREARKSADDVILYKSVGSALQDVVISEHLFEQAKSCGLGVRMPVSIAPLQK